MLRLWDLLLEGSAERPFPGLANSVPAVAYHFCLNLPAAFSQPGNDLIVKPSKAHRDEENFLCRLQDSSLAMGKFTQPRKCLFARLCGPLINEGHNMMLQH